MNDFQRADAVLTTQLGHDVPMSLATGADGKVSVRVVDGYYENGRIYLTSHSLSKKALEIAKNPQVALCKDLFRAEGTARNLGNPLLPENREIREVLRRIFVSFYDRHVLESDPGTCIIRIDLSHAVFFDKTHKYTMDFAKKSAEILDYVNDIVF